MANVTPVQVKEIIDTDITTIDAFIKYAVEIVTNNLADSDLTENTKIEIQRWLTAHLIASTLERQAIKQKAGPAEQEFSDIYGKGLYMTSYGQMVLSLDNTGILKEVFDTEQLKPIKIKAIAQ